MKKTNSMRVAIVMLALALITSCFVGGTFAKYTTNASGGDSARVAKFGVTVTANTENPTFKTAYESENGLTVKSEEKVVAPGTSGTMADMTISGSPEVAVNVAYKATLTLSDWTVDDEFYCPIVITVAGTDISSTGKTEKEFIDAVEAAIANCSADYSIGDDLSNATAPSISWAWAFDTEDKDGANDAKDTALGNAETAAKIKLDITATVTQID